MLNKSIVNFLGVALVVFLNCKLLANVGDALILSIAEFYFAKHFFKLD
ncbi:hypothetical protein [Inediibacterium massiliense]|nr:hypothetical protein [Inediibacterium massiliense]